MFKGVPQSMRDQEWHTRHSKRLKKRKALAKSHILFGVNKLKKAEESYKKAQARESQRLIGFIGRFKLLFAKFTSWFNRTINKLFKKTNYAR